MELPVDRTFVNQPGDTFLFDGLFRGLLFLAKKNPLGLQILPIFRVCAGALQKLYKTDALDRYLASK